MPPAALVTSSFLIPNPANRRTAGRTGRGERGGRVLVQTTSPNDPAVKFASKHDFIGFAQHELAERYDTQAPPFSSVARVIFRGPDEMRTRQTAQAVADRLRLPCWQNHQTYFPARPSIRQ